MLVTLTSEYGGCYALTPVSRSIRRKLKKETGNDDVFIQTDWDFPGIARSLGWRGKIGRELCEHRGTDGTVTCPDCGMTATEFITAASAWLDKHDGCTFRGKADEYFEL